MAKISPKRKEELQLKFGKDALRPITKTQIEYARRNSARYILFKDKDNQNGHCEFCNTDVTFDKTKHKKKIRCPKCRQKMTVQHIWRKPNCDFHVDWFVYGKAIDEESFVLRYIAVFQYKDYTKSIKEYARDAYDFKMGSRYEISFDEGEWNVGSRYCFTEFTMNWCRRYMCCWANAKEMPGIKAELKKIKAIKYLDNFDEFYNVYTFPRDKVKGLLDAPLYEKLIKAGLGEFAMKDYKNYWERLRYKRTQTSLIKMLGLNKISFNAFRQKATKDMLSLVRNYPNLSSEMYDLFLKANVTLGQYETLKKDGHELKILRYCVNQGAEISEYLHYVDCLKRADYPLTKSYLYPKDFFEADMNLDADLNGKDYKKQNRLIKKISKALKEMKDLQSFMEGSNGLLVYVPESTYDLKKEGRRMHNCVGSYTNRIAEGKTLVFFIRKLNDPTASFVTMEYCNGEVIQVRSNYNKNVEDTNIINFVDAFAEKLRKNKILCKAA